MAIKHVVLLGFGSGGAPFIPTFGFSIGAAVATAVVTPGGSWRRSTVLRAWERDETGRALVRASVLRGWRREG